MNQAASRKIIIVGGGVVGLMTALELAHRGIAVHLVDSNFTAPIKPHSGELAVWADGPANQKLLDFSRVCWAEAAARYTVNTVERNVKLTVPLEQKGWCEMADSYAYGVYLAKEASSAAAGSQGYTLVEGGEAVAAAWGMPVGAGVRTATVSGTALAINVEELMESLRKALVQNGVVVWGHDSAVELVWENGRVVGVRSSGGDIAMGSHVLLTTAGALRPLQASMGTALPLRPARGHVLTLSCPEGWPGRLLAHRLRRGHIVVGRQPDGNLLLSYDGIADAAQATFTTAPNGVVVQALQTYMPQLVPALAHTALVRTDTATYAVAPDFMPIMGDVATSPGLGVALGFGSRAYAYAAGVARLLGQHYAGEQTAMDMSAFALERFGTPRTHPLRPQSLDWPEMAEPVDMTAPKAMHMENVEMVGKTVTAVNENAVIQETGKTVVRGTATQIQETGKTIIRGNAGAAVEMVGKTVTRPTEAAQPMLQTPARKGKVQMGRVQIAPVK